MLKRHNSKTPQQHQQFADNVKEGMSMRSAMIEAGWSEGQANKGTKALSQPMIEALLRSGVDLANIGAKLNGPHLENAITGLLYTNMLSGESRGNEAAIALGKSKRAAMFTPESQVGIIVVQPPPEWAGSIEERVKRMDTTPVMPPDTK